MKKNAIAITSIDTIAVATLALKKGEIARLQIESQDHEIVLLDDIEFGHKLAIMPIAAGEQVIKYGESIGTATRDIQTGEWVHVHNIESDRGRGDRA